MDMNELIEKLSTPMMQQLTVCRMAITDLKNGNLESAVARLRVDADKIRTDDMELYEWILNPVLEDL